MFRIAVAGAHLSGFPLNHQLTSIGAQLVDTVNTAAVYKMFDLGGIKPALIRQSPGHTGFKIELEIWEMPISAVGTFLRDGVSAPLAIGDLLLDDGSQVKGFVGESYAITGMKDISECGGWRQYKAP